MGNQFARTTEEKAEESPTVLSINSDSSFLFSGWFGSSRIEDSKCNSCDSSSNITDHSPTASCSSAVDLIAALDVPDDLLVSVFCFLSPVEVVSIGGVCKSFFQVSRSNAIWKQFVDKEFLVSRNTPISTSALQSNPTFWFDEFKTLNTLIPPVFRRMCRYIEQPKYIGDEGLYRTSGSLLKLDKLKYQAQKAAQSGSLNKLQFSDYDAHVVSSFVKYFIRGMRESNMFNFVDRTEIKPLCQDSIFHSVIDESVPLDDRIAHLRKIIWSEGCVASEGCSNVHPSGRSLQQRTRFLLHFLAQHLHTIAQHSFENKMNARNLAIIFSPHLFRLEGTIFDDEDENEINTNPEETSKLLEALPVYFKHLDNAKLVLQLLIEHHNAVFSPLPRDQIVSIPVAR